MNAIVVLCDTLRRDHCGPYNMGKPLNECGSKQQPDWIVPTPNMDRLASMGTVFDNAWCGSTPCLPARRDIYTGRFEFLERGWGPLAEEDLDLPRQVSGPGSYNNRSVSKKMTQDSPVSYLVTDHFHLWEEGAGNYHMGYTGFDFIRGHEGDMWFTDPIEFPCPADARMTFDERHFRCSYLNRKSEEDTFAAKVFTTAADWLKRNRAHKNFYLHLDCFDPHEPWDAPEELVKMFDPNGYNYDDWIGRAPYRKWRECMTQEQFKHLRARYAAHVVLVDRWLGKLLDAMDELDLWKDTMLIFTTDHGTFNGDHDRMGKLQTHEFDSVGHIPFIVYHPQYGHGERRSQLVQLVDIYNTVLKSIGRPIPPDRHGKDLTQVLKDAEIKLRDFAIAGQFGKSITITDGRWILHQSPVMENKPLYWYDYCIARKVGYEVGQYINGRREVLSYPSWSEDTWLSDKSSDPMELMNLAEQNPEKVLELQKALKEQLIRLKAPSEQLDRLSLRNI